MSRIRTLPLQIDINCQALTKANKDNEERNQQSENANTFADSASAAQGNAITFE
jgi:hypothetical protein